MDEQERFLNALLRLGDQTHSVEELATVAGMQPGRIRELLMETHDDRITRLVNADTLEFEIADREEIAARLAELGRQRVVRGQPLYQAQQLFERIGSGAVTPAHLEEFAALVARQTRRLANVGEEQARAAMDAPGGVFGSPDASAELRSQEVARQVNADDLNSIERLYAIIRERYREQQRAEREKAQDARLTRQLNLAETQAKRADAIEKEARLHSWLTLGVAAAGVAIAGLGLARACVNKERPPVVNVATPQGSVNVVVPVPSVVVTPVVSGPGRLPTTVPSAD